MIPSIISILRDLSSDAHAYAVGGYVRDGLRNKENRDIDLVVDGDALGCARRLSDELNGSFYILDDERKIGRAVLPDGWTVDVSPPIGLSIEDDLKRRDFTINSMAVPIESISEGFPWPLDIVIDPTGGIVDLSAKRIRAASATAFIDDPVRLVRAFRFSVQLGFTIDRETVGLVQASAGMIEKAPVERVAEELFKILDFDRASGVFAAMDRVGVLIGMFPEMAPAKGSTQNDYHHLDVWGHSLLAMRYLEEILGRIDGYFPGYRARIAAHLKEDLQVGVSRRSALKLAAFLHDAGKPKTRSVGEDGRIRFYGHPSVGEKIAGQVAERLHLSSAIKQFLKLAVKEHMRPGFLGDPKAVPKPTERAVDRFLAAAGDEAPEIIILSVADILAMRGSLATAESLTRHKAEAQDLMVAYFARQSFMDEHPPLVDGDDIKAELHIPEGPEIGRILKRIRRDQLAGRVHTRRQAINLAKKLISRT